MNTLQTVRRLLAMALLCLPAPLLAAIQLTPVVSSGLTKPIFVAHAGDGTNRLFIVEQGGFIRVLPPGAAVPATFLDISTRVLAGGERGLLGLAFHPRYPTNGRFFVYYTRPGDGAIVIAEYAVSGNPDVASTAETVLLTIPHPTNANHNGGMLAFGPDGYLYIGVGDGGSGNDPPNNAQNIDVLLGKILRIDVDHPDPIGGTPYSSPGDNPYVGRTGRDEIFALGWRNPWRFSFDRVTHQQWVADVGQNAREEVDTPIVKGGNYGWRVYEGSACTSNDPALCTPANYLFPVFDYAHTGGRCSITGGYVYRGTQGVLPSGTYVYADYCSGEIFAWNGAAQTLLLDTASNISSFGEDEQGELYVVGIAGTVSKIVGLTLNVALAGSGTGTVTGNPGSICVSACSVSYPMGTDVVLIATPDGGSVFSGWSGACTGSGICTLSMSGARNVTATFAFLGAGSTYANTWGQKSYVAYYGRPADPAGLAYWAIRMDLEGGSLASIIAAFGTSNEFTRRYGGLANSQLLDALYQQTLGRAPDPAGRQYYLDQLNTGRTTVQKITLDLLGGATGSDVATVANRLDVANHFTGNVARGCPYAGESTGVASLAPVSFDPATAWAAKLTIETRCGP